MSDVCGTCRQFDADQACCQLRNMPVNPTTRACPDHSTPAEYARRVAFAALVAYAAVCGAVSFAAAAAVVR